MLTAILMYHRIADDRNDLCVPPAEFREHLRCLDEAGYRVLPLEQLADALRRNEVTQPSVAITFDDGYVDALTQAAPILSEYEFPATFFVVSSTLEAPAEFWWDTLERIFASEQLPPTLEVPLPEGARSMPTATREERKAAQDAVRMTFYTLTKEQRSERIEALLAWSGIAASAASDSQVRAMTPSEVQALDRWPGMNIGAHSVSHLLLPAQSRAVKEHEIRDSKQRLEQLLGREVPSFSYPYGGFDEETVELTQLAGFTVAVSTGNLPASPASHPLILPRCVVRAGDDLQARLQNLFSTGRAA